MIMRKIKRSKQFQSVKSLQYRVNKIFLKIQMCWILAHLESWVLILFLYLITSLEYIVILFFIFEQLAL